MKAFHREQEYSVCETAQEIDSLCVVSLERLCMWSESLLAVISTTKRCSTNRLTTGQRQEAACATGIR